MYRRYVEDVYHYALALLRNPADAEDVTQTTFLNAYRAYVKGVEVKKPQNWLIKITHNVARTRYTQASRRVKEVPLENHVEQLALPEADRPDVHGVLSALGQLPFNQRAALVMRELEGRSYAEIADTIGVSVSAVETLIFRARRSLRLKASALRSIALVPLPPSLTQFFDAGGVVAGGGALAGGGILLKVAVALVAGAVATGISSDRSGHASAAADSSPRVPAHSLERAGGVVTTVKPSRLVSRARAGKSAAVRSRPASTTTGSGLAAAGTLRPSAAPQTSVGSDPTPMATATSSPVSQVTEQAASLAETAQQALGSATAALPIPVPALPLPPVDPPKLPGGTPLP